MDRLSPYALSDRWLPDDWWAHAVEQAARRETHHDRRFRAMLAGLDAPPDPARGLPSLAWLCALRDEEHISGAVFIDLAARVAREHT